MNVKKARLTALLLVIFLIASSFGAVQASAANEISMLVLNKNEVALEVGSTASLTATAVFVNGATENVTLKTDWSTGDAEKASVYAGVITAKKEGKVVITATYMEKPVIVTVTISKNVRSLVKDKQSLNLRKGQPEQIGLTAYYGDNTEEDVTKKATWSIDNGSVATVFDGMVKGLESGTATITAKYNSQTVTIPVSVEIAKRVDLNQSAVSLLLKDPHKVTLKATYPDGTDKEVTDIALWESDNPEVADVIKGEITGYSAGQAKITGTYGTKSATIVVDVDKALKLELDKQNVLMKIKTNPTEQLKLTATFAGSGEEENESTDITERAEWTSSNESAVSVVKGKLIANGSGQATITAKYGEKTVTTQVDVDVPRRLEADSETRYLQINQPESSTLPTDSIILTATYADGSKENVSAIAEWSSDNEAIADVSKGVVKTYKAGEANVTAKYGGKTVKVKLLVDVPTRITPNTKTVNFQIGSSEQIVLKALYTNASDVDVTSKAEWTTSAPEIAEVRNGQITGIGTGTATITAKYGTRTATVQVSVGVLKSLTTTSELTLPLNKGDKRNIDLKATYTDGTTSDVVAEAVWASSNEKAATVDQGAITAVAAGEASVTATYGGKTVTLNVKVDMADKLKASSTLLLFDLGETKSVVLTATDSKGKEVNVTKDAEWKSANEAIAEVTEGVITPISRGKTTVTAKYGGKTVTITLEIGIVQSLTVDKKFIVTKTGETVQLQLSAELTDGSKKDVTDEAVWKSSSYKIADVTNGMVTAMASGTANISATYGGKTITVPVEINKLKYFKTDKILVQMTTGGQENVKVTATFEDQSDLDVTIPSLWTTSNIRVADVKDGVIKAIGKGKATITVTYGKMKATVYVTVN
ncbi:Ig domain-containing protein [Paenibacillus sp. MBLB4367]|uniref:Ig-like domain-containing protein n=1 Tax=Paenibacillus sp. MBLB4367 TaxID=3384767 RepID=UPI0039083116